MAFVGLAIYTIVTTGSLRSDVNDAQAAVATKSTELAGARKAVDELKESMDEQGKVELVTPEDLEEATAPTKAVSRRVKLIEECLPEIQSQLYSIEFDDGYIDISQQLSRVCNALLYPPENNNAIGE